MRGGHTNCANTWFQRFTKRQTPLLPHFCVWWEIVGEGKWGKTAPGTITSVRGATDWFVPFFVQSLLVFFCDIFMLERKHNRATRETGHGKTGYFHVNDNEEKATSYPLGDREKLVKIFLSVGKLVMLLSLLFIVFICLCFCPIVNFPSVERPVSSSGFSLCSSGSRSVSN